MHDSSRRSGATTDIKHLATVTAALLRDYVPGSNLSIHPRSGHHEATPLDLERARDIAQRILEGRAGR